MQINKPTLVLLHGWGVNQGVWQNVAKELEKDVTLLTLDIPGFGLSKNYPIPYEFNAVVDQLALQLPDNSYVCGWSLGGLLAISLAHNYPHKVRELGLIASSPCFMAQDNWPGMADSMMQQFGNSLSKNLPLTIERFLAIQAMGSANAKADIQALKQAIMAYPMANLEVAEGALAFLKTNLKEEYSQLKQPVVGFFGRLDSLVPLSVIEKLKALKPKGEYTVSQHASHAPFISHPNEFVTWIKQWLSLESLE